MSIIQSDLLLGQEGSGKYQVSRSLRYNAPDSSFLSRTPASTGNRKTWTLSLWVKRSALGAYNPIFATGTAGTDDVLIQFNAAGPDQIHWFYRSGGSFVAQKLTTQVFRDVSAWYHLVFTWDTTNATAADRMQMYVNGIRVTTFSSSTDPSLNLDASVNNTVAHRLGTDNPSTGYLNGYMADIWFLDGIAATPSDFAETDATTGQWIPKTYTGSKGTNGFHLEFADNSNNTASTLGKDTSGNSPANNWTPNNFSVLNGGATTVTTPATNSPPTIDFLVIGGGGGGTGGAFSGGGGAGGYRTSVGTSGGGASAESPVTVTASTAYSVIVGAGGALSANGSDSVFGPITSLGGGRGGGSVSSQVGGSGGGGGPLTISPAGSAGTANQGFAGADGYATNSATPGGGGAGGAGSAASGSTGGAGGAGITSSITGTAVTRAAGGRGGDQNSNGVAGAPNTGNGAQGHWNGTGAVGGSGIVILRYANTYADLTVGSGLTYTYANTGGYKIYSFTASTTFAEGAGNDCTVDTPTSYGTDAGNGGEVRGNYCTLNPLRVSQLAANTFSNGNLDVLNSSASGGTAYGTFALTTGKWYFEATYTAGTADGVGWIPPSSTLTNFAGSYRASNGVVYDLSGSTSITGSTYTTNDIIGCAIDFDAGKAWFAKNGTWQGSGNPATGANPSFTFTANTLLTPWAVFDNASGNKSFTFNFGQRSFAYNSDRSGFKALCDTNLPTPVVAKPNTVMDVKLYTGNGSTQTISGLGFSPDFVWLKSRSNAYSHQLYDAVRGAGYILESNTTSAQAGPYSDVLNAFTSNGFTLGSDTGSNGSGNSVVAWCWDAGSSTVTNTQGSISSQVRANATAGFSIVTYTGNGSSSQSIGHGLGVAPKMVIIKNRNGSPSYPSWYVRHESMASNHNARLELTEKTYSTTTEFFQGGIANLTSSTVVSFNTGTNAGGSGGGNGNVNTSGVDYVAYCFAPVAGYSSFGSYTGNGSSDGPFVYTGFRPRWILFKNANSSATSWDIYDTARNTYNLSILRLFPDQSIAESNDYDFLDINSNGFKIRNNNLGNNGSGNTIIYAAFAESPFQYARAR